MSLLIKLLATFLLCSVANGAFPNVYPKIKKYEIVGAPGDPLILTPLIEEGQIEQAKAAAEVDSTIFLGIKSYAGYFTVDGTYNSNLFFWFFPSESDYENDPVVLWLQGGPGVTSLVGLFEENGPFSVNSNLQLRNREYSWTKSHSVIYIDNPVGTGYSFSNGGYAQNETKVGQDLYSALVQFFTVFPELQKNEFYLTGESYAGKYVPAIGYTILKENPQAELKINLQGLAIGNGWTDPEHQVEYGNYLFQLGLVDSNTRDFINENEKEVVQLIQEGRFKEANARDYINLPGAPFLTATGLNDIYNYLSTTDHTDKTGMGKFIQLASTRTAIHVGSVELNGEPVGENLEDDEMQSVAPWVSELLSNYRVLFYNGQLDIIVAYPYTVNFLQNLEFDAAEEYKVAERRVWRVDNDVAGYVKQAGNLTEALVRNAGHMVPADQAQWASDLLYRFTRNQFNDL